MNVISSVLLADTRKKTEAANSRFPEIIRYVDTHKCTRRIFVTTKSRTKGLIYTLGENAVWVNG